MMALALPAQANGGWLLHVDVVTPPTVTTETQFYTNRTTAVKNVNWTAPPDTTNSLTLPVCASDILHGTSASGTVNLTFAVKITGTWQGTDPAPPSVEVIESASATASPSLTPVNYNGAGKAIVTASVNNGLESAPAGSLVAVTPSAVPPAHLKTFTGSTWSITRTFAVSVSATYNSSSDPLVILTMRNYACRASLDSYNIQIHAQPYNFHRVPGKSVKGYDGTIGWTYGYSSTSGSTKDLTTCYWHEYVTYPGLVGTIAAPNKY